MISMNWIWNSTCLRTNIQMIDGMLHIRVLLFFLPSPLDGDIDVHVWDGQNDAYEGLWDAVLSRDCACHAAVRQAHPHSMLIDNIFALLKEREYRIRTTYSMGFYSCEHWSNQEVVNFL